MVEQFPVEQFLVTSDGNQSAMRCGHVLIAATGLEAISDESVDEFIRYAAELDDRLGQARGLIQYSPSQSPSAAQRKKFAAQGTAKSFVRVAILSDSAIVRGAITAIAWLTSSTTETRAFRTASAEDAITWLAEKVPLAPDAAMVALDTVVRKVGLPAPAALRSRAPG